MNILTTELEYQRTFHIVPQVTVRLGKSWNVSLNWLNFELEVKHISTALNNTNIFIHTPYVTLTSYMQSAYHLTLDLCWLGYTYRKGIWLKDGEEPRPADNTPGFVTSEWFAQFRKEYDLAEELEKMLDGIIEMMEKKKEELEKE